MKYIPLTEDMLTTNIINRNVRFIDNELNRAELNQATLCGEHKIALIGLAYNDITLYIVNNPMSYHYSRFEIEEQAKFADVKVGDWVEINTNGNIMQIKVDIKNDRYFGDTPFLFNYDGTAYDECLKNNNALRIVPPSEVIIDFGSFRGKIEAAKFNDLIHVHNNGSVATIPVNMLSPAKRAECEALLKQMEEK